MSARKKPPHNAANGKPSQPQGIGLPDLTLQEIILNKWELEWGDRLKAHIQRIAEETGCTWWDVVMDCRDLFLGEPDYLWDITD